MGAESEKYVYGVVRSDLALPSCKGIAGRRVSLLGGDALAAVVSPVEPPVTAGKDELSAHAQVLQRVLDRGPVLPMRFGVVMPGEAAVREELLEPYAEDLLLQLGELENAIELHLRAIYEEHALMSEIVASDREVAALSAELRDRSADATYYARIELGERVARGVERAAARDREEILAELEPLSIAVNVAQPQHERVACDAAFLIERSQLERFDRAVDELGRRNEARLRFSYTGPHPAYGFVELAAAV